MVYDPEIVRHEESTFVSVVFTVADFSSVDEHRGERIADAWLRFVPGENGATIIEERNFLLNQYNTLRLIRTKP